MFRVLSVFFFKQKTAYEMRISDWSSDVCSSDLLFTQAMVFNYTKYPNAAKEYLRFMWEREQYAPWQQAALGYISHPLAAYASNPVWTSEPKTTPYRDAVKRMLWNGNSGPLGYASAAAMADYIVVYMFAQACAGDMTTKEAAASAAKRAARSYRVWGAVRPPGGP